MRRELRKYAPLQPTTPEGSRVKVNGRVHVLDETVIAPLTGRECVLSRSRVRRGWVVMMQIKPFLLVGSDGSRVVIDGSTAVLGVEPEKIPPSEYQRELAFYARFAIPRETRTSVEEIVIAVGDRITVGGVLMRDLNPQPPSQERAFREHLAPRLRIVGSDEHPLVIVASR